MQSNPCRQEDTVILKNNMDIIPLQSAHLDEAFALLMACREALEAAGIYQWTDRYPSASVVAHDIKYGGIYGFIKDGRIAGIVT